MSGDKVTNKYQFHRLDYEDDNGDYDDDDRRSEYNVYRDEEGGRTLHVGEMSVYDDPYSKETRNVHWLRVARGHAAVLPTLLGIGQVDAQEQGRRLRPDQDLSPHSVKIVKHLQRKGIVTGNRPVEQHNNLFLRDADSINTAYKEGDRLNTGHVNRGRQLGRKVMKEGRQWA